MNPKVDTYLDGIGKWQEEMGKLRKVILDFGLREDLKWGHPCYSYHNSNVVIIQAFKAYCAIMFFKGSLLQDANGILVKPGEQTQAGRQIRFTQMQEIYEMEPILKDEFKKTSEYETPGNFSPGWMKCRHLKLHLKP